VGSATGHQTSQHHRERKYQYFRHLRGSRLNIDGIAPWQAIISATPDLLRRQSLPSRQAIVPENVVLDGRSRFFTKGKADGNQATA
jgi:hypothetical protein